MNHPPADGKTDATDDPGPIGDDQNGGAPKNGAKRSSGSTQEPPAAKRPQAKPALSFTLFRDLDPNPSKQWLVNGLLGAGELSCLYGRPGSSKSTIVGDLGFHIAAGQPWFDRQIQHGGVLYVAAERPFLVERRMAALGKHYNLDDIPLAVVKGGADLRNSRNDANLIEDYAKRLADLSSLPTILIIIDTINRVLAGGDENSSMDMGKLVGMLARLQEATGAHILTTHHMPVESQRMRGHGSLLAACDVTALVERKGAIFTATIEKANDGPTGERIAYTLRSIDLHHDAQTGITTVAPVVVPASPPAVDPKAKLTPNERTMLSVLQEAGVDGLTLKEWYECVRAKGFAGGRRASLSDTKKKLEGRQVVHEDNGIWRASSIDRSA